MVLKVEVNEHDLVAALCQAGRLNPDQALHRAEIEQAATLIIADFVARWTGGVP